jgi:hypothetical protein
MGECCDRVERPMEVVQEEMLVHEEEQEGVPVEEEVQVQVGQVGQCYYLPLTPVIWSQQGSRMAAHQPAEGHLPLMKGCQ